MSEIPGNDDKENFNYEEKGFIDVVAVIWKRKFFVIGITAFAMIAVLAYAIISLFLPPEKSYLPNVYTPKATMIIQNSASSGGLSAALASSGLSNLAGLAGVGISGSVNGALASVIATSNSTLDSLDREFLFSKKLSNSNKKTLVSETRDIIKKKLLVKFDTKTNIFAVSFTDIDPKLAKEVVDETVHILEARFASLSGDKSLQQKALLEKKLADVDSAVSELEEKVKAFQTKYGVVEVEALATEQITVLARLRSELILKEIEISNYEKISLISDPAMIQLKNERDGLLAKIKEIETGKGTGSRIMPSQNELPGIAFEYTKLERDLLVQTELFKLLTQQYELAKLNVAGQEPVFQILEMAEIPDKKSGPSRGIICIAVTMAGFFISIFIVFMIESIDKVRKTPMIATKFKSVNNKKGA